jgi:hypothetical protein
VFFLALVFIPSVRRVLSWGFGLLFAAAVLLAWLKAGVFFFGLHSLASRAWALVPFGVGLWLGWYQVKGWLRRRRAGKS